MKKNFNPAIKLYLLSAIESEMENAPENTTEEIIAYAKDRFYSEYGFNIKCYGVQGAIREWLLGLALPVDYTYCDIESRLKLWGVLDVTESETKTEKALDQYWDRLAANLLQMFNKI